MKKTYWIQTSDQCKLAADIHESGKRQWLIVLHGMGEHRKRHSYLIKLLSGDYNLAFIDLRGHGESEGPKAQILNFDRFRLDLIDVLNHLKKEYRLYDYALFAHSMGAVITCSYLQKKLYPDETNLQRVFLSSPPINAYGSLGMLQRLSPTGWWQKLGEFEKGFYIRGIVNLKYLSHNPEVKEKYLQDPLNHVKIHSSLIFNLAATAKDIFSRPLRLTSPCYVIHGSGDRVCDPNFTYSYFTEIEKGALVKRVEGGYHELYNELKKYQKPYFDYVKYGLLGGNF